MGEPGGSRLPPPRPERIGPEEATGGTETSKYPEEEKSNEIPLVVASERGPRANRRELQAPPGSWGRSRCSEKSPRQRNGLGGPATQGDSPVREASATADRCPSTAGHVKPGGKLGGPPSNPKYSPVTDSGQVP